MSTTGAMISGHAGETSFDPRNLTGQIFMKGKRENTFLQLIGGMNAVRLIKSKEFECGQEFEVPSHTTLPERLEGAVAPTHTSVARSQSKNVVEVIQETVAAKGKFPL